MKKRSSVLNYFNVLENQNTSIQLKRTRDKFKHQNEYNVYN